MIQPIIWMGVIGWTFVAIVFGWLVAQVIMGFLTACKLTKFAITEEYTPKLSVSSLWQYTKFFLMRWVELTVRRSDFLPAFVREGQAGLGKWYAHDLKQLPPPHRRKDDVVIVPTERHDGWFEHQDDSTDALFKMIIDVMDMHPVTDPPKSEIVPVGYTFVVFSQYDDGRTACDAAYFSSTTQQFYDSDFSLLTHAKFWSIQADLSGERDND